MEILGAIVVLGLLGIAVWSLLKPAPQRTPEQERDYQIGVMIGSLGGGIEEAVQARYAISRLKEQLGRKATLHEIAVAIGATNH